MGGWEEGRMGGWEDGRMGGWEDGRMGGREDAVACPVVRVCWWPGTVVLPAAEVLDFEFWILDLFRISNLGFRIS